MSDPKDIWHETPRPGEGTRTFNSKIKLEEGGQGNVALTWNADGDIKQVVVTGPNANVKMVFDSREVQGQKDPTYGQTHQPFSQSANYLERDLDVLLVRNDCKIPHVLKQGTALPQSPSELGNFAVALVNGYCDAKEGRGRE